MQPKTSQQTKNKMIIWMKSVNMNLTPNDTLMPFDWTFKEEFLVFYCCACTDFLSSVDTPYPLCTYLMIFANNKSNCTLFVHLCKNLFITNRTNFPFLNRNIQFTNTYPIISRSFLFIKESWKILFIIKKKTKKKTTYINLFN